MNRPTSRRRQPGMAWSVPLSRVTYLGSGCLAFVVRGGRRAKQRHNSQSNVVFCDGHVEALTFQTLFWDTNDVALSRWNKDHEPHRN